MSSKFCQECVSPFEECICALSANQPPYCDDCGGVCDGVHGKSTDISQSSYSLTKCAVNYWGSSGPGTSRSLKVRKDSTVLSIAEDLQIQKPYKPHIRSPVEIDVSLSEEASRVVNAYLHAYTILEEAKAQFKKAEEEFRNSTGGKEVLKLLRPEEGPMPVDEVVSNDDMSAVLALVKQTIGPDNSVVSCKKDVAGYDIGMITIQLEKPILLKTVENLKHGEYFWSSYDYTSKCIYPSTDTSKSVRFAKKGYEYPPYRMEDYKEVSEAEKQMLAKYV